MKLGKYLLALMMALGFANVSFADDCCSDDTTAEVVQEETTAETAETSAEQE